MNAAWLLATVPLTQFANSDPAASSLKKGMYPDLANIMEGGISAHC